MLIQVTFAYTRTLDVRFEFVIRKNNIFRRSVGIEHNFFNQKICFCGHPGELFFSSPGAPETNLYFFGLSLTLRHILANPQCKAWCSYCYFNSETISTVEK